MADQLPLPLDPDAPRLPASLRPMLPRLAREPFDSPDHLFEPTWGGERVLAFVDPPGGGDTRRVRLVDPSGRDLAPLLAELADLPAALAADSALLDGELVAVDAAGRPDPTALGERLAAARSAPVAFLAFDLLHLDGRSLLREPLERRRALLAKVLAPGGSVIAPGASIVAVPAIAGEGIALHRAVAAQGLSGVMARERRSPYLPGTRSAAWRFVPAGEPIRTPDDGGPEPAAWEGPRSRSPIRPILAVFERLPLDD